MIIKFILFLGFFLKFSYLYSQESCSHFFKLVAPSVLQDVREYVKDNRFTIDRDLFDYFGLLHPNFIQYLISLNSQHVWLDSGAGLARAQIDYHNAAQGIVPIEWIRDFVKYVQKHYPKRGIARTIAVSLKKPYFDLTLREYIRQKKIFYIEADIIDITRHGISLASVDLITDVYGPLKYSAFDKVLQTYMNLLKPKGHLYFNDPHIIIENPDTGEVLDIVAYLRMIPNIKVKENFEVDIYGNKQSRRFEIIKTSSQPIKVPALEHKSTKFSPFGPINTYSLLLD